MSLSNSTLNTLRTEPYYDDAYNASNTVVGALQGEVNDFHRILFRPKFPVQSRELTQVQTLLQAQLERLGKTQFKDGEAVLGGGLTLDTSLVSGQVTPASNIAALFNRTTNDGKYVIDSVTPTTKAHVLQFLSSDEGETSNSYLLFKYQSASPFLPGAVVQAADDASLTSTFATGANTDIFKNASIISIDEGVFFVSGFFVRVAKQSIVLSPFTALPSYRIGLEVDEQFIDELDDVVGESLLDPAVPGAPGAHRFRIKLALAKRSIDVSADVNFIELARVVNGVILQAKQQPGYVRMDELNKILARRTNDESGDYIVTPFAPVLQNNPEDANTFILSLGPGKAYVRGFEVHSTEPVQKVIRKGRVTANASNKSIPATLGNFVYATRVLAKVPSTYFANSASVDLHTIPVAAINTSSSTVYTHSKIGTAKVRILETFDVPSSIALHANNSVYKLFFYDVEFLNLTGNVTTAVANGGTSIVLTVPVANGTPAGNETPGGTALNALQDATIILSGASSPVTGTFTVSRYDVANSTVAYITLAEFLPTLPNANTTYKLLFQMRDVDAFANLDTGVASVQAPYSIKLGFQADVDVNSKIGEIPTGKTVVFDTNENTLIYEIPEGFVKANTISANTAIFKAWEKTSANAVTVGAVTNSAVTITVSGANFSLPSGSISAELAKDVLIIFDQTADANGRGEVIQFADSGNSTNRFISGVTISQAGSDYNIVFTYHQGSNISATRSFIGLAKTTVAGMPVRQKTLYNGNTSHALSNTTGALYAGQIEFHTLNAVAGFAYSLKTADVFRIRKVLYKEANTGFSNTDMSTATDVSAYFSLDTGQRDNTYEYSNLIVGAGAPIRPTGRILVVMDWFDHSGRGYLTLDSYLSTGNVDKGMTYDIIPEYRSAKSGERVELRDALDFRPTRSNYDFTAAALVYAASDASTNTTYLTASAESYLVPASDDVWFGSYQYYLGRWDKIGVFFDGQFKVIEGIDSLEPTAPTEDAGSLLLYQLNVPPYTLVNSNGVPTSVLLKTFDHRRYTMKDLARIDERVAHLEYYTALNSLEQITSKQAVLDSNDIERFKNGILVDSFLGGNVGEITNPDFTASIDTTERELHTAFRSMAFQFAPDTANSTSTGVVLVGDIATLEYDTETFISQPLATHAISVNPFDVASFFGTLSLSPAVDTWKDTQSQPAQIIDLGGPSEAWVSSLPSFTNWGEWERTWSGVTSVKPRREVFTPENWTPENHGRGKEVRTWNDVTTKTNFQRQGTQFEFEVTSTTESIGNVVRDTSIIHHCRARDIVFAGIGLKPASPMYPFFDGTNVLAYTQQANILQLETIASSNSPFYLGQTLYIRKAITGNVETVSGNTRITGESTFFTHELVQGQLIRITQGVNTFDTFVMEVTNAISLVMSTVAPQTLANATLYTLTPVTVADISRRITGATVQHTLKVVRAVRDADADQAVPYAITAGSLRPEIQVNDTANTTVGAMVIIPPSARGKAVLQTMNVVSAIISSGIVRSYTSANAALRLDNDITDALVTTPGTKIYFVGGPGQGQSANITAYNAATQVATVDTSSLTNIVAGQTIYSVGIPMTDGFIANSAVTSGRAGTIAGCIHLPAGRFATGTRQVRLTDNANNTVADSTSVAELNYTASGLMVTEQEVSVASRSLGLSRGSAVRETMSTSSTTKTNQQVRYVDPLAQTFVVDGGLYPQGIFVSSIDICFGGRPTDDIPVIMELRPAVNGYPASNQIVPCPAATGLAIAVLNQDQVQTSTLPDFANSATVTTFTFPAPVHLLPGQEYAIVIRSDSPLYTVYTAELGGQVVGSDAKVSKQPYAGSFFKSQNASTWTESPFEDLMFRITRCVWDANSTVGLTGILVSRSIAPDANTSFDSLEFYPHEVQFTGQTLTSYALDIKPMNLTTGDLTAQVAVRYPMVPNTWDYLDVRSMVQGFGGANAANNVSGRTMPFGGPTVGAANTIDGLFSLTTFSRDVAPYIDVKKTNVVALQHRINNMELIANNVVLQNPGSSYLANLQTGTVTTNAGDPIIVGTGTFFSDTLLIGDSVVVGGNLEVIVLSVTDNTHFVATANLSLTRTANTYWRYGDPIGNNAVVITISGGNGANTSAGYMRIGTDGKLSNAVFSNVGSGFTETPTLTVPVPAAPGGDWGLPVVNGAIAFTSELSPRGGNSLTRYLTRPVTLADGFDARDIVVYFDAYRPLGSHFYVYCRVLAGDADKVRFEDQPWRLMEQVTPDTTVSTRFDQFKEFSFKTPNDRALDSASDNTDKFKVWAIKIVFAGSSYTDVPRLCNFRAIALDE